MPIYKKEKEPAVFVMCDCHSHAIHIERYRDDDDDPESITWFEFSIWNRHFETPMSIKERIRWAWYVLTKGRPYADHVMLSPEKVRELAKFLNSQLLPPKP